jgi:hypothetical protein
MGTAPLAGSAIVGAYPSSLLSGLATLVFPTLPGDASTDASHEVTE